MASLTKSSDEIANLDSDQQKIRKFKWNYSVQFRFIERTLSDIFYFEIKIYNRDDLRLAEGFNKPFETLK